MFDSFPYQRWSESVSDFWTWGGHNSTGTYVLTVLGGILVAAALTGWVLLERRALQHQATAVRESGIFAPPTASSGL